MALEDFSNLSSSVTSVVLMPLQRWVCLFSSHHNPCTSEEPDWQTLKFAIRGFCGARNHRQLPCKCEICQTSLWEDQGSNFLPGDEAAAWFILFLNVLFYHLASVPRDRQREGFLPEGFSIQLFWQSTANSSLHGTGISRLWACKLSFEFQHDVKFCHKSNICLNIIHLGFITVQLLVRAIWARL